MKAQRLVTLLAPLSARQRKPAGAYVAQTQFKRAGIQLVVKAL